ncbi:hypothetical protein EV714DRAFT_284765 [Schizophyllum commune]
MDMEEHERGDLIQRLGAAKPDMIQETFAADPWKVLIATIFLNVTHGTQSIPIVHALLEIWDTPEKMAEGPFGIYPCIRHLGLGHSRSKRIVDLSRAWISRPLSFDDKSVLSNDERVQSRKGQQELPIPSYLPPPGVGRYALDSFRTFCTTSNEFLAWKWAYHEHRRWHPERGPMGYADAAYIESLIANLALTTPGGSKSSQ